MTNPISLHTGNALTNINRFSNRVSFRKTLGCRKYQLVPKGNMRPCKIVGFDHDLAVPNRMCVRVGTGTNVYKGLVIGKSLALGKVGAFAIYLRRGRSVRKVCMLTRYAKALATSITGVGAQKLRNLGCSVGVGSGRVVLIVGSAHRTVRGMI